MSYLFEKQPKLFRGNVILGLTKSPHFHPHLEMVYLRKGSSTASLDGKSFLIDTGDIFLSFPNQIHHYFVRSAIQGDIVIFAPEMIPDLQMLFENKLPVEPVIKKEFLPKDIGMRISRIMENLQSQEPFAQISAKGELMLIMAEIIPHLRYMDTPVHYDSVKDVLLYCTEHFTEPLTLDMIAEGLHLNKYYISHIFSSRLQISFSDFLNGLRVDYVCKLLTGDCSVTEAAFASGFSSIRTFNRAFARQMGKSPTQYLKDAHAFEQL